MNSPTTSTTSPGYRPQLSLPGQAASPEGPVDMTMMYLMHHAFRRDLAAFVAVVPRTPVDDQGAWAALADRWQLFSATLHNHHEGEDKHVWPALMGRADAEERAVLAAMEAEHAVIDPALTACRDGITSMVTHPSHDVRNALAVRLVAAREHLTRHLAHEETEAIAFMQRVLSAKDWDAIEARLRTTLTLPEIVRMVPWVIHELPLEARRQLFGEMPGGTAYRLIWVLTRRRFARADRRAFAHAA